MTLAQDEGLWVRTAPDPLTGAFVVAFNLDADRAWTLSPDEARDYALTLLATCGAVEYDLAVLRQMTEYVQLTAEEAGQVVRNMRAERPSTTWPGPLSFTGGVTSDKRAFLQGRHRDDPEPSFQVDCIRVREHATAVLDQIALADLDDSYLKVLRTNLAVDEDLARTVVADLSKWRER